MTGSMQVMSLLLPSVAILALCGTLVLQQLLHQRQTRAMLAMFCEKHSISPVSLGLAERPEAAPPTPKAPDSRKRLSIPVPTGWRAPLSPSGPSPANGKG